MKVSELLSEVTFGGQDVEGNALEQFKEKFPNLSTLMYFIPGFGQALMAADMASQIQMYNQAIAKIEQKYPPQTIQAAQQQVGDSSELEPINEACWKKYKQVGMKKKGKKTVPNCVPK